VAETRGLRPGQPNLTLPGGCGTRYPAIRSLSGRWCRGQIQPLAMCGVKPSVPDTRRGEYVSQSLRLHGPGTCASCGSSLRGGCVVARSKVAVARALIAPLSPPTLSLPLTRASKLKRLPVLACAAHDRKDRASFAIGKTFGHPPRLWREGVTLQGLDLVYLRNIRFIYPRQVISRLAQR